MRCIESDRHEITIDSRHEQGSGVALVKMGTADGLISLYLVSRFSSAGSIIMEASVEMINKTGLHSVLIFVSFIL